MSQLFVRVFHFDLERSVMHTSSGPLSLSVFRRLAFRTQHRSTLISATRNSRTSPTELLHSTLTFSRLRTARVTPNFSRCLLTRPIHATLGQVCTIFTPHVCLANRRSRTAFKKCLRKCCG